MIYNLVSCRKVVSKVYSDLDLQEELHPVSNFIEWIGESLKKIGAFPSLITRVTGKEDLPLLVIDGYQAKLPADLNTINQVAYSATVNGPFYPMRYATGSFATTHPLKGSTPITGTATTPTTENGTIYSLDYSYIVVGGWIKTNIKDGYLLISYQAIPVDADNYPLVPDDEAFFEAIYWYINMKLLYPQWRNGQVRDAIYYDAKSSWNYHRKQAYANAMMPNSDQLESIFNSWVRLIPNINTAQSFYSTMGEQEIIYNKNQNTTVLFPYLKPNN